jgi:hypothetical protein
MCMLLIIKTRVYCMVCKINEGPWFLIFLQCCADVIPFSKARGVHWSSNKSTYKRFSPLAISRRSEIFRGFFFFEEIFRDFKRRKYSIVINRWCWSVAPSKISQYEVQDIVEPPPFHEEYVLNKLNQYVFCVLPSVHINILLLVLLLTSFVLEAPPYVGSFERNI